jgi:Holin of 3TMs, for gene-transfer release
MSEEYKPKEDWMTAKWRPMMGWMYMLVCICDFIIFPVLWSIYHAILHTGNIQQWNPLTLQGAGLFHMAMGAIIGVAAFGRTQEKLAGVAGMPGVNNDAPIAPTVSSTTQAVNTNGPTVVPKQSMPEL